MPIDTLSLTILLVALLYAGQALALSVGIHRSRMRRRPDARAATKVSIIVAARNEAATIEKVLDSLGQQDYPEQLIEIFVVDDASTDATASLARGALAGRRNSRVVQADTSLTGLNGKARALATAICQSSGEIILITDADCEVTPSWVRSHLAHYHADTGMVGGFVALTKPQQQAGLFVRLQSLDWHFLCAAGAGAAGLGQAISVFGNNCSFRRVAYDEAGGFNGAGFSVIEDFALLRAMQRTTRWRLAFSADPGLLVQTAPAASLSQFFHQRKRWALGARTLSLAGRLLLLLGFAGRLAPLAVLLTGKPILAAAMLAIVLLSDLLLAGFAAHALRRTDQLRLLPLYYFFVLFYGCWLLPAFLFSRAVRWKGREYTVSGLKRQAGS